MAENIAAPPWDYRGPRRRCYKEFETARSRKKEILEQACTLFESKRGPKQMITPARVNIDTAFPG